MSRSSSRPRFAALAVALALAATGLVASAGPALAVTTYPVSGLVTFEGSGPAVQVSIELDDPDGDPVYQLYTDSAGNYSIDVEPGTYTVYSSANLSGSYYYYVGSVTVGTSAVSKDIVLLREYTCTNQIVGSPNVGQTLSAVNKLSPAEPFSYLDQNWYRYTLDAYGGPLYAQIPGATGSTYTVTDADLGYRIAYDADIAGTSTSRYGYCSSVDASFRPVVGGRLAVPVGSVAVVGKAKVGKTVSAVSPTVPAGVTGTYQWYRVSKVKKHHRTVIKPIAGATGATYKLKKKDRGTRVLVQATYSGPAYTPSVVTSTPRKVKG